jgi:hypothetical protein
VHCLLAPRPRGKYKGEGGKEKRKKKGRTKGKTRIMGERGRKGKRGEEEEKPSFVQESNKKRLWLLTKGDSTSSSRRRLAIHTTGPLHHRVIRWFGLRNAPCS